MSEPPAQLELERILQVSQPTGGGAVTRGWSPALVPCLVGGVALVLRLATAATGPTDWDSAQYAAAVTRFDVTHGLPQPPGYWLYVSAGRLLVDVGGIGTVRALVLIAALASAAGAGLTALAGSDLGGRFVGLAAGLVVATSPFAWFSGAVVATYSFDLLACALLLVLAWRARPGSWHGVWAIAALGLLTGFRQSIMQSFALLALVAIAGSTRTWRRALVTLVAGAASVAIWFLPMLGDQPGGLSVWTAATRTEATGAARATSVLDHAAGGATNIGTFAGYTVVALVPLAVVSLLAVIGLFARRMRRPAVTPRRDAAPVRPWYQRRAAVLGAAIVPPVLLVSLVQFAKGGYLLAYLPAATIALLVPVGTLVGDRDRTADDRSPMWFAVCTAAVVVVVVLGVQRFVWGDGVVPQRWVAASGGIWLVQARYQAPYADTRSTIRTADGIDLALRSLGPSIREERDVVVFDTVDGGANIYRNAGWELPRDRIALVDLRGVVYNQLGGALYYASGTVVAVGPGGSAVLVASPALPGLAQLVATGEAVPIRTSGPIGGYLVFRLAPGSSILGVRVVATHGLRPLGTGI